MTQLEQLRTLFRARGILSVRDPACTGIPFVCFSRLCAEGFIDRIGHGVYSCPAYPSSELITYAEAAAVIPKGVVCLFSALKIHGLKSHLKRHVSVRHERDGRDTENAFQGFLQLLSVIGPAYADA